MFHTNEILLSHISFSMGVKQNPKEHDDRILTIGNVWEILKIHNIYVCMYTYNNILWF